MEEMIKKLKISILVDSDEIWYNKYLNDLLIGLKKLGHQVILVTKQDYITGGDICFILSCINIIPETTLAKNKNNIVIHASDLPKGRGWSPMSWQILDGKDEIPLSLFEARNEVDSGKVYIKDNIKLNGNELIGESREKLARKVNDMAISFVKDYPMNGEEQKGKPSFYSRRRPKDSELDINKTIKEQFNLLRIVDNENYPAFFTHKDKKYIIKIRQEDTTQSS